MGRFTQSEMFGLNMGHGDPLLDAKKKESTGTDEENPMPGQDEPVVNKDEKGKGKKKESYLPRSQRRFTNREHPALEHDDPLVAGSMHKKEGAEDNPDDNPPPNNQGADDQGTDDQPTQTEELKNADLQAIVNSIDDFFEKNIDKIPDDLAEEADAIINDFVDFLYDIDSLLSEEGQGVDKEEPEDSGEEPEDSGEEPEGSGDDSGDNSNS